MTITICSSASFYQHVCQIQEQLQGMGYTVLIPYTAEKMRAAGSFKLDGFKPPVGDVKWKRQLMDGHFDKVDQGDVILIVNDDKPTAKNYIGGNVLMEMTLAYRQGKPIVLLNDFPEESILLEEIIAVTSERLHGKVQAMPEVLAKLDVQSKK